MITTKIPPRTAIVCIGPPGFSTGVAVGGRGVAVGGAIVAVGSSNASASQRSWSEAAAESPPQELTATTSHL